MTDNNYHVGSLIYDAFLYDGLNTHLADLPFYKKWLPKNKDTRILELCCGTGRLTLPIAKEGYQITGIDLTASMLAQAKIKAAEEGLNIEFIEADIRSFSLPDKMDFIFLPFNSICHLYTHADLFQALHVVRNHLKEDGLFLLDCFNPNIQYIAKGEQDEQVIAQYTAEDGRAVMIKESMHYESKNQINRITWHYYINGAFHSTQNLDMRLYFPQELDAYLEWNGFTIRHKFGSFDEEAFQDHSEKQIYICQAK